MKIGSIKEPRQLDDGTVKASITVSDDDFIPLIQLIKDAKKGDEPKTDDLPDFIRLLWTRYAEDMKDSYERGKDSVIAYLEAGESIKPEVIHESPERQELVTAARDKVLDNRPIMGSLEDANRDSY